MNRNPRYNWKQVQAYYDAGNSMYRCIERFGFSKAAWSKAVRRGDLRPRDVLSLDDLLRRGKRRHIKRRLLQEGVIENRCSGCGIRDYNGKPLSMQLDHINGINDDYRLTNLRMLCPNCHSLTDTYGGRNVLRRKRAH